MKTFQSEGPYSPISISKELWPWCLFVICILTVGWTAFTAWGEASIGNHQSVPHAAIAAMLKASAGVPIIIIYSIIIVLTTNFVKGGGIMVMARATKDYLYDKIERQRERLREQGREEGREILAAEVADWNRRRLEAESRDEPFDEPPPGV